LEKDTMATHRTTTRRTVLAIMGGALAQAAPATATPATPEFAPEPTLLGRRYLRYLALIRFLWSRGVVEDGTRAEAAMHRYDRELANMRAEIVARPVQSVADMVDRLILAAHDCDTVNGEIRHKSVWPALGGALAAAGINPHECCEDAECEADEWAFPERHAGREA
jgi:hypothetical protein